MDIEATKKNIDAFLHYGWLPRLDIPPPIPLDWIPEKNSAPDISLKASGDILRNAVRKHIDEKKEVLVPLSGGLDSRVLLAITHELGLKPIAATVGVPNTFDFDIPQQVAQKNKISHRAININELPLSTSELVHTAREIDDWTNIIEINYNLQVASLFKGMQNVSGFLGDFIAGSYAHIKTNDYFDAKRLFAEHNNVSRKITLTDQTYIPEHSLPTESVLGHTSAISNYEELVLRARHTCSLRPNIFSSDLQFKTPFQDREWVRYMFGINSTERNGQKKYHEILNANWPEFFSLPTKNFRGLPILHSHLKRKMLSNFAKVRYLGNKFSYKLTEQLLGIDPMTNYTDFHNQIVYNKNIREVVRENLIDLEKRDCLPWINLNNINETFFAEHRQLTPPEGNMLIVLANLEINLKAINA